MKEQLILSCIISSVISLIIVNREYIHDFFVDVFDSIVEKIKKS